ncbi:unnamed protein product [Staurois parvus]|uniref:Uncharacterized protein n=1 Tax=Staurois parvus TaxID=386267 RepID=A0ABN9AX36_9NEOB|nr:unnamed protein product [Staurois parvus]
MKRRRRRMKRRMKKMKRRMRRMKRRMKRRSIPVQQKVYLQRAPLFLTVL